MPREDYRFTSLNCGEEDFAIACIRANLRFGKNQKREDVKSHHYILLGIVGGGGEEVEAQAGLKLGKAVADIFHAEAVGIGDQLGLELHGLLGEAGHALELGGSRA